MSRIPVVLSFALLTIDAAPAAPPRPVAVLLDDASSTTRDRASAGVLSLGGRVVHEFDDVLIVELPPGTEFSAYRLAGVREVALNGVTAGKGSRGVGPSLGVVAWNAIAAGASDEAGRRGELPASPSDDALIPPAVSLAAVREAGGGKQALAEGAATVSAAPYGATELNTSEFLAGSVSVNVILVESDGSIDPSTENWTSARENEVVARIALGLEWIRVEEPQAALRFVYHVFAGRTDPRARTRYEPIRRVADPTGSSGEDLWAKDVLARMGYASGDRSARSRALAASTRGADGTDWAVNVFVVDSLVDADGSFADGRFAYCWVGGPHLVMTYDNQAWGVSRMDMVLRHELLHAFYAFDEYSGSACVCDEHRGYLDGANTNCTTCNPAAASCVMITNGDAMCQATRRQVGWADLDGDGAIDVIGEDPDTFLDATPTPVCATPELVGLASVVAPTNRNPLAVTPHQSISVNRISGVEVRVDGSPWTQANAADGFWGMPQQRFHAAFPELVPGSHRLEARALDDFGNRDLDPGSAQILLFSSVSPLGDSVRASRSGDAGLAMSWGACGGATRYRVYRAPAPGAGETMVVDMSETVWSDEAAATGYYQVRPVDACGAERFD